MVDLFETALASISDCGTYRWWLSRNWDDGEPLVWVMLNPSTADADIDDQTIRRVRGFTKREGYPGFLVVNVWALRATSPDVLHAERDAYEAPNIQRVQHEVLGRDVIVAWGARVYRGQALRRVRGALMKAKSVRCLGFTKGGEPRHPLMLRADTPMVAWPGRIAEGGEPQ